MQYLHYLFYASQSQTAATDPVVLWLNGGGFRRSGGHPHLTSGGLLLELNAR